MKTKTLHITGMTCSHCMMSVRKELSKVATVRELELGRAVVEFNEASTTDETLKLAIDNAGYRLESAD